jgi:hypothetical protein
VPARAPDVFRPIKKQIFEIYFLSFLSHPSLFGFMTKELKYFSCCYVLGKKQHNLSCLLQPEDGKVLYSLSAKPFAKLRKFIQKKEKFAKHRKS